MSPQTMNPAAFPLSPLARRELSRDLVKLVLMVSLPLLFFLAADAVWKQDPAGGALYALSAALLALMAMACRKKGGEGLHERTCQLFLESFSGLFGFYLVCSIGLSGRTEALPWYYLYALLVLFVYGAPRGILWIGGTLAATGLLHVLTGHAGDYLGFGIHTRFALSVLLIMAFSVFMERTTRLYEDEISRTRATVFTLRSRGLDAEKRRMESDRKYRALLHGAPLGIVVADAEGFILEENEAFTGAFGKKPGAMPPERLGGFFRDPEDWKRLARGLTEMALVRNLEAELVRADGSGYPALVNASRVTVNGVPVFMVMVRDLTREKQRMTREEQAHRTEAAESLARGLAHDFNNFLAPIMGYAEMSLMEEDVSETIRKNTLEIMAAARRAGELARRMLSLSGSCCGEMKAVDPEEAFGEGLKMVQASLPSNIVLQTTVRGEAPRILADVTALHQILLNLASNAVNAMKGDPGLLMVELDRVEVRRAENRSFNLAPGLYARLSVSDTGPGMAPETVKRIFEPYFTTRKQEGGTGMGMAMVRGIVKNHGGSVTVYSEPGQGTTIRVYLPAEKQPDRLRELARPVPANRERILLVDDERTVLRAHKRLLTRLGYRVFAYADPRKAREALRREPGRFDLLLTDLSMPHVPGPALVREAEDAKPPVPAIVCTGFSEMRWQLEKERVRAPALIKPVDSQGLERHIRRALDAKGESGPGPRAQAS